MLDPHFTLVFPLEAPPADVVNEARGAASDAAGFPVTLRSVRAVRDVFGAGGHVFLVPGQGAKEIAALNARLPAASSAGNHADIPYVPHITVASHTDFSDCETLAASLAADQRDMNGTVEALTVVEIVGARVAIVANLPLGGGK